MNALLLITALFSAAAISAYGESVPTQPVTIRNVTGYSLVGTSHRSGLYQMNVSTAGERHPYDSAPYLLVLRGDTRERIGYDYAALLGEATAFTYHTFLHSLTSNEARLESLAKFIDFLWDKFYVQHVPSRFLRELKGMAQWCNEHAAVCANFSTAPHVVSHRFFVLANMPADMPNIISALEREFERGWPAWLRHIVNDIIKVLEKYVHKCDSYGVWGSRTQKGRLYTSRNLDFNANSGINMFKLVTVYDINETTTAATAATADGGETATRKRYSTFGFAFGLGALAGQSHSGITTSEMNLDNSRTTFSGLPFPLRLRYVMEEAHDLKSAMTAWNATNNTNSFNFMIGSAADGQSYALETMFNFTAQFPADSPIEAAATYDCGYPPHEDPTCKKWVWQANHTQGKVPIGFPLKEAVWRTNHGMNPTIMRTQEPLFNDTVFRYRLMHRLFVEYEQAQVKIADYEAVKIVATLGIKGQDFLTCHQPMIPNHGGSNILSVAYVPGEGRAFVAWEEGSNATWRPAACAVYYHVDLNSWWQS